MNTTRVQTPESDPRLRTESGFTIIEFFRERGSLPFFHLFLKPFMKHESFENHPVQPAVRRLNVVPPAREPERRRFRLNVPVPQLWTPFAHAKSGVALRFPSQFKIAAGWKPVALLLAGSVLLTACNRQATTPPVAPAPEVATITIAPRPILLTTELPGRTSPFRIAEIRPQVSGLIQKRLFEEGSDVRAGQALYQIDPAPFQAELDNAAAALGRAEANLPAARSRLERYQQALADRAVSRQAYDDAEAALKQAEADAKFYRAALETARINLNYAGIVSPISGRIGASTVTDGAIVTAYQSGALATIQQLDPIYVDVTQSSTELLRLHRRLQEGQLSQRGANESEVELVLGDGTKYPTPGKLQFRDISVEPTTASVTVRLVFPNPAGVLLPGMFVRAVVKEGVNEGAILIPQQTVSRDPKGNPYVLLVDDQGKVEQRKLTLDRALGDQWLVRSGLESGNRVIAEGIQKIRAGMTVKTVPFEGGGAPGPNSVASVTLNQPK